MRERPYLFAGQRVAVQVAFALIMAVSSWMLGGLRYVNPYFPPFLYSVTWLPISTLLAWIIWQSRHKLIHYLDFVLQTEMLEAHMRHETTAGIRYFSLSLFTAFLLSLLAGTFMDISIIPIALTVSATLMASPIFLGSFFVDEFRPGGQRQSRTMGVAILQFIITVGFYSWTILRAYNMIP